MLTASTTRTGSARPDVPRFVDGTPATLVVASAGAEDSPASVVVPTYDRPQSLARCLAALARQTLPVEVIVVHDGDKLADQVDAVCRSGVGLLVRIAQGGPAAARNAGAARSDREFVLFADDDCEPAPDWAERLVSALGARGDVVAGAVVNASPRDPYATATQVIHDHLMEDSDEPFATTNNVGCSRQVIGAIPFDETYPVGGEDRDWCHRVLAAGFTLEREPAALVLHRHQLTLGSFVRKHVGYGIGSQQFRNRNGVIRKRGGWYLSLMRRGFRYGVRPGMLVGVAQAAGLYGAAREAGRSRR